MQTVCNTFSDAGKGNLTAQNTRKPTLRRPGLCPGPRWGNLQRSRKPPSWWGGVGCPLPMNPIPRSRPFGPRVFYPHSKISSDAHGCFWKSVEWFGDLRSIARCSGYGNWCRFNCGAVCRRGEGATVNLSCVFWSFSVSELCVSMCACVCVSLFPWLVVARALSVVQDAFRRASLIVAMATVAVATMLQLLLR